MPPRRTNPVRTKSDRRRKKSERSRSERSRCEQSRSTEPGRTEPARTAPGPRLRDVRDVAPRGGRGPGARALTRPPYADVGTRGYSRRRTSRRPGTGTVVRVKQLSRPARRAFLVVHVVASASWLGLTLGLLALGVTATTGTAAVTVEACVRGMKLFADRLLLPAALLTLLSGLVLSLGTSWGLARHRWVWTKFWLTLATTAATAFALRPAVNTAVTAVAGGE